MGALHVLEDRRTIFLTAAPMIGRLTIEAQPGDRWALLPWGPSEAVELLLLDMRDPPAD